MSQFFGAMESPVECITGQLLVSYLRIKQSVIYGSTGIQFGRKEGSGALPLIYRSTLLHSRMHEQTEFCVPFLATQLVGRAEGFFYATFL
jgi:hypothetical protein